MIEDVTDLSDDEKQEMAILYMVLHEGGWPLTEDNEEDLRAICVLLLVKALMRTGVSYDLAVRKIVDDDGDFKLSWSRAEGLSFSKEFANAPEDGVAVTITAG